MNSKFWSQEVLPCLTRSQRITTEQYFVLDKLAEGYSNFEIACQFRKRFKFYKKGYVQEVIRNSLNIYYRETSYPINRKRPLYKATDDKEHFDWISRYNCD